MGEAQLLAEMGEAVARMQGLVDEARSLLRSDPELPLGTEYTTAGQIRDGDVIRFPALPEWLRVHAVESNPFSWDLRLTVSCVDDERLGPIAIGANASDRVMRRLAEENGQ